MGAGAGNACANIAREFVRAGHEVVVVTTGHGNLPAEDVSNGIRVLRGPAKRRRIDRSTAFEQVVFMLGATVRCLALLRAYHPDAVLAFFGLPSGGVAWFLRLVFGVPYIVSLRGGDVPGFRPYDFWLYHRLAVPLLRVVWRGADAVVANSGGLQQLAAAFDSRTSITIVPNGVDASRFWNEMRDWSEPRLLSVGRVVYQKGLDLAVQALGGMKDQAWEWRIAGDGPQSGNLRAQVEEAKIAGRVQMLGWTDTESLIHEYQRASVFLFPSRHEGMPNAILEAMASGLPVIATRIAGNEELILDGETGRLVPPGDVEALRDSIAELLADGTIRERMGRAAHERVVAEYGWAATADRYLTMLEEAGH